MILHKVQPLPIDKLTTAAFNCAPKRMVCKDDAMETNRRQSGLWGTKLLKCTRFLGLMIQCRKGRQKAVPWLAASSTSRTTLQENWRVDKSLLYNIQTLESGRVAVVGGG